MAQKTDIKEGATFKTLKGHIGKAYAVTQKNIDTGMVNLLFEGNGSVLGEGGLTTPCGIFRIDTLELIHNK